MQKTMVVSDDTCPTTGRVCHLKICEQGGCKKIRKASSSSSTSSVRMPPTNEVGPDRARKGEVEQLKSKLEAVQADRSELAELLNELAVDVEKLDACLKHIQQALNVKSSPLLEDLRELKSRIDAAVAKSLTDREPSNQPVNGSDAHRAASI